MESTMRITAIVATLLLATASMASAQGGPDGRMGGGPAGGGIEGPAGPGGGAPSGGPDGGGGGSDGGGPALRGPEGPGTGGSDGAGPGLGDAPRAAREARPEREARQPEAKSDRGDRAERPDRSARKAAEDAGDGARKTRKSVEDAGSKATRKTREATEKATSDDKPDAGQARTKDAADDKTKDAAKDADDASRQAKDSARDQDKPAADTARAEKPERAKQVELSGEKRDRVQTALRDKPDVKHRTDVHIDISVGRRLPRDWDFAPVPIAVIEIVPEYRDYVYVWVEEEYLICDPVTYEVVAVIPAREHGYAAASRSGGPGGKCTTRIELSADERELILESVRSGREVDVSDLEIGWSVPSEIALERFPEPVLAEAAELSACRYFVADDQLAIVDPDEDKVVLLIDKS
jgi:hypothetical protein